MHQLKEFRTCSCIGSNPMEQLPVELKERAEEPIAQFACIGSDRIKNRLDTGRRAPDYAKDVAGGRLLFECASKLCVTSLHLLEQASVLDRNQGLIGKGADKSDLLLGEGFGDAVEQYDHPHRFAVTQQRHCEDRAHGWKVRTWRVVVFGVGLDIRHMHRTSL